METKVCKRCNQEKEIRKFGFEKKQNKRVNICRMCYQLKYFPQKDRFSWNKATYEEKIERLKKFFDKHVIRQDGCWGWKGSIAGGGYPMLMFGHKQMNANRISFLLHNGELKDDIWVLHKCDNKICTNPDHLFLGTPRDNTLDKIQKGRDNPRRKLTVENVKKIKNLLALGVTMTKIARDYSVNHSTISAIKRGITWKTI